MRGADPPGWGRWAASAGMGASDVLPGLSFTDEIHAIQATVAGQGVGLLSLALVSGELAAGTLVQPFGPTLEGYTYSLVYPRRAGRPVSPRCDPGSMRSSGHHLVRQRQMHSAVDG